MVSYPDAKANRVAVDAFEKGYANPVSYALHPHDAALRFDHARRTMEHNLEEAVTEALEGMAVRPEQVLPQMARYIQAGHPEGALELLASALAQGTAVGRRRRRRQLYALTGLMGSLGLLCAGTVVGSVLRAWGVL